MFSNSFAKISSNVLNKIVEYKTFMSLLFAALLYFKNVEKKN